MARVELYEQIRKASRDKGLGVRACPALGNRRQTTSADNAKVTRDLMRRFSW